MGLEKHPGSWEEEALRVAKFSTIPGRKQAAPSHTPTPHCTEVGKMGVGNGKVVWTRNGWSFKARLMEEDEKRDGGPTQTGMVQSVLTPALETDYTRELRDGLGGRNKRKRGCVGREWAGLTERLG